MKNEYSPANRSGRLVVPALSITVVLLLAASWLLAGHLVTSAPPLLVAAGRTAGAFITLTVFAMLHPRSRSDLRTAAKRGRSIALLGFLGFFAYYTGTMMGIGLIGASRVGLITSLLPSITFVIGLLAFREHATWRKVLGTILAVLGACGYALVNVPSGNADPGSTGNILLGGGLLALGGTIAYAVYSYVYRWRMADVSPLAALTAITGAGTLMLGSMVGLFVPVAGLALADWGGIAVLGVVLTAPIFLLLHEIILRKGPLFTAALQLAVPFLIRLGEWALGWEDAPGPLVILLLLVCAGGVWLTVTDRPGRADITR